MQPSSYIGAGMSTRLQEILPKEEQSAAIALAPDHKLPVIGMDDSAEPPAWLFGLSAISGGATFGAFNNAMPFLLSQAGVRLENIGWYSIALLFPMSLRFLYAPITEIGLRWKTWFLLLSGIIGVCFSIALRLTLPTHLTLFLSCLFIAQLCVSVKEACQGALAATTLSRRRRDRAAGLIMTGGLLGGALGAFALIDTRQYYSRQMGTWLFTAIIVLPPLSLLFAKEPARPKRTLREVARAFASEFRQLARQRETIIALLLCALPTGTWAALFYLPSLGKHYHATPDMIALATGGTSWVVCALGAFASGFACARYNRLFIYILASAAVIFVELLFLVSPLQPAYYVTYCLIYYFLIGVSLSAERQFFSML